MNMVDFFNPNDIDHIDAYQFLCGTGEWPRNFIPDCVEPMTYYLDIGKIQCKMAEEWVKYKMGA
jgi:hypothetical protein